LRIQIVNEYKSLMAKGQHVSYLILDFRMVDRVDTTAVKKIKKLIRYTDKVGLVVIITNLTPKMRRTFVEQGVCERKEVHDPHHHGHVHWVGFAGLRMFDEADEGIEWAVDRVLERNKKMSFLTKDPALGRYTFKTVARAVLTYLKTGFGSFIKGEPFDTATFRTLGRTKVYAKGGTIAVQGGRVDKFYFISNGSVLLERRMNDGRTKRIEKRHAGTLVDETPFFLGKKRHVSITAAEPNTEIIEYDREAFSKLEQQVPRTAEACMAFVMRSQHETIKRLTYENHLLMADTRQSHRGDMDDGHDELVADHDDAVHSSSDEEGE